MNILILASSSLHFPLDTQSIFPTTEYTCYPLNSLNDFISSPHRSKPFLGILEIGTIEDVDRALLAYEWAETVQPLAPARFLLLIASKNISLGEKAARFRGVEIAQLPLPARNLLFKVDLQLKLLDGLTPKNPSGFVSNEPDKSRVMTVRGPGPQEGKWDKNPDAPQGKIRWRWVSATKNADPVNMGLTWNLESKEEPEFDKEKKVWVVKDPEADLVCERKGEEIFSTRREKEKSKTKAVIKTEEEGVEQKKSASSSAIVNPSSESIYFSGDREKTGPQNLGSASHEKEKTKNSTIFPGDEQNQRPLLSSSSVKEKPLEEERKASSSIPAQTLEKKSLSAQQSQEDLENTRKKTPLAPKKRESAEVSSIHRSPEDLAAAKISPASSTPITKEKNESAGSSPSIHKDASASYPGSAEPSAHAGLKLSSGQEEKQETKKGAPSSTQEAKNFAKEDKPADTASEEANELAKLKNKYLVKKEQRTSETEGPATALLSAKQREKNSVELKEKKSLTTEPKPENTPTAVEPEERRSRDNEQKKVLEKKETSLKEPGERPEQEPLPSLFHEKEQRAKQEKESLPSIETLEKTSIAATPKTEEELERIRSESRLEQEQKNIQRAQTNLAEESSLYLKMRLHFTRTLEELNDKNSSWHPIEGYRIYLSAQHRYYGVQSENDFFPLWVYEGELAPEFLDQQKAWKFYDRLPIAHQGFETLPPVVLDYVFKQVGKDLPNLSARELEKLQQLSKEQQAKLGVAPGGSTAADIIHPTHHHGRRPAPRIGSGWAEKMFHFLRKMLGL